MAWSEDMIGAYKTLPKNVDVEEFAKLWVNTILRHKPLLDLSPALFVSLERNSSEEQLESFKRTVQEFLTEQSRELRRIYPFLNEDDVRQFLTFSLAIMSSLWPASNPDTALAKVYRKPDFQRLRPDFVADTTSGITTLLNGLRSKKEKNNGND
jgi:hypothetical protein